ncbi:MAG: hypothetical protein COY80_03275 [Candidatus Pacebacteria bacterium CG_4_10_14_0_8_um_filter_42_14]|nr:MAG: hypothetical protein COY80_03275 [Candidatus Pacebacteria bacterium CG_4_10_14_0_8_um_filter_42_14]
MNLSANQISIKHQLSDLSLLTGLTWGNNSLSHQELAKNLEDKSPYTVTIILDNLAPELRNRKTYIQKTRHPRMSLYREHLHQSLTTEFGKEGSNKQYSEWIDKYRQQWLEEGKTKELDDYILELEMEPRYQQSIENRYKNLEKLKQPRSIIRRERYYTLPEPISRVDWRSPYDNLFIWTEGNHKYVARGGSGSSGARETNSRFIFALGLLNQRQEVPSHLFLYDKTNKLQKLHSFPTLTVPKYDIGANYHLDSIQAKRLLSGTQFIWWEDFAELKRLFLSTENVLYRS